MHLTTSIHNQYYNLFSLWRGNDIFLDSYRSPEPPLVCVVTQDYSMGLFYSSPQEPNFFPHREEASLCGLEIFREHTLIRLIKC